MRLIGLIGGMSWESTLQYYRLINQNVRDRLGALRSAELLLYSVDFGPLEQLQHQGRWGQVGQMLGSAARQLECAGARCVVLCTNTMHKVAVDIESAISVPLLHIADPTGVAARKVGATTVGLLGTRFTMEDDFFLSRLEMHYGLRVLVPEAHERLQIHRVIYEELCAGQVMDASRELYRDAIRRLVGRGAQAVILGCTEIMLLIGRADSPVPVLDTTELHAMAAVDFALAP